MISWSNLELSTGEKLRAQSIGAPVCSSGELVFTTAMVGYTEALTDPSYFGQMLVFAYPLIGNYGIPAKSTQAISNLESQFESAKSHVSAVIIADTDSNVHHWTSHNSLHEWLLQENIPGLTGVDTRFLINKIREHKQIFARILPEKSQDNSYKSNIQFDHKNSFFDPNKHKLNEYVSTKKREIIGKGKHRIAVYDFGIKWSILRQLLTLNCEIELLPYNTPAENVDCSAWLLSNGPGNPIYSKDSVNIIEKLLLQNKPILGICLGHQLLALACKAKIAFMNYGHRSHNQPVKAIDSNSAFITSQNHSYVVEKNSLPDDWKIWFSNINDGSVEGIKHKYKPFMGVQFHPEAAGGPKDTKWILEHYLDQIKTSK
jgi:carbamoyl-phosphate synthase small subunit